MDQTQLVVRYAQGKWTLGRPNYAFLAFRTKRAAVQFGRTLAENLDENVALVVRPKPAHRTR